jgi:hypothetical protein
MFDFFGFECGLDETEFDSSAPGASTTGEGGFGFGSGLFLGGALGMLFGGSGRSATEFEPMDTDLGSFSSEEKSFLVQAWRLEKELTEARRLENWERTFLLVHAVSASINEGWAEFFPEHSAYDPSPRFHAEIAELLMPLLHSAQTELRLDFANLISPERMKELQDGDISMNYDSMEFTLNGFPIPND